MSGSLPYMSPRVGGGVVAGMPWWLRCRGRYAADVPPAAKGERKRRGWGTGGKGRYMVNKRGREGLKRYPEPHDHGGVYNRPLP